MEGPGRFFSPVSPSIWRSLIAAGVFRSLYSENSKEKYMSLDASCSRHSKRMMPNIRFTGESVIITRTGFLASFHLLICSTISAGVFPDPTTNGYSCVGLGKKPSKESFLAAGSPKTSASPSCSTLTTLFCCPSCTTYLTGVTGNTTFSPSQLIINCRFDPDPPNSIPVMFSNVPRAFHVDAILTASVHIGWNIGGQTENLNCVQ